MMNFLVMPIYFLSGALYPLSNLPKGLAVVTRVDPLTYGIDGLRGAFISAAHFSPVTDAIVMAVFAAFFLLLGARAFAKIQI
jgi:ABC-2 type transport system permease protein